MEYRIAYIINSFINIVLGIVEALLGLRFILRLFGANAGTGFVDFIYDTSRQILEPFFGVFPTPVLEEGLVLELSTLFAMVIYALLGYLLMSLVSWVARVVDTAH